MSKRIKILHLEDVAEDADLVERALCKAGVEHTTMHTDDKQSFIKALVEFGPDIILSDHSLPSFDSHEALRIITSMNIRIPFILITATVSEEYAVTILKEGASDYILKGKLQRLPSAINAALEKYNAEEARQQAIETLKQSERKYKLLFEGNPMPMWMIDKASLEVIAVNESSVIHYGYTREEFLTMNARQFRPAGNDDEFVSHLQKENKGIHHAGLWRHIKKDGSIVMVDIITQDVVYEGRAACLVLGTDVTGRLEAEAALSHQRILQQKLITETSIEVQERERNELGKELHDNINQILATAKLYLQMEMGQQQEKSPLLQKTNDNILLAVNELRKLSHTLVAPSLGEVSLKEALEDLVHDINITGQLQMELIGNFNGDYFDHNISLMFYRVVQEQVNNILKHAGASKAAVQFDVKANEIKLTVSDNGKGFDTITKPSGIGLKNIINRVGFYDGITNITSAPGKGCTLEVTIPL